MNKCIFDKVLQLLGMNRIIAEKELEKACFELHCESGNGDHKVVSYKLSSIIVRIIRIWYEVTDSGEFVREIIFQ